MFVKVVFTKSAGQLSGVLACVVLFSREEKTYAKTNVNYAFVPWIFNTMVCGKQSGKGSIVDTVSLYILIIPKT